MTIKKEKKKKKELETAFLLIESSNKITNICWSIEDGDGEYGYRSFQTCCHCTRTTVVNLSTPPRRKI